MEAEYLLVELKFIKATIEIAPGKIIDIEPDKITVAKNAKLNIELTPK